MSSRIQIGYGSDTRKGGKRGNYAGRNTGKVIYNGGFNHQPVSSFEKITDEQWKQAFGDNGVPWYEREDRYKG